MEFLEVQENKDPKHEDGTTETELSNLTDEKAGSLGGAFVEHAHKAQVAGTNELIRSDEPDKGESLLKLLSMEGIYVWSKVNEAPPLLTLVKVDEFVGLLNV